MSTSPKFCSQKVLKRPGRFSSPSPYTSERHIDSGDTPKLNGLPGIAIVIAACWLCVAASVQGQAPSIVTQPKSQSALQGASYTFTVSATGAEPVIYQWCFNGANLAGQTNSSLPLSNLQTNQSGNYQVIVTNLQGAVTSSVAILVVRSTNDPAFPVPDRGWTYLYTGDGISSITNQALDGAWDHDNNSDSWGKDGRGAGNGLPGGVSSTNGILTIEDEVASGASDSDNRRIYFKHNLLLDSVTNNALLSHGVTLTFRARLTPPPPSDPLTELPNAPNGYVNGAQGRGMFGIRQADGNGMIISFSLNEAVEDITTTSTWNFGQPGLHMNNLNGNSRSAFVDPNSGGTVNLLPLDPSVFHEFWITIQDNGSAPGTHGVTIYVDGSLTPNAFHVTAGNAFDATLSDPSSTNYLAMGLSSTGQRGAVDVEFFGYKPGVIQPAAYNDPVGITTQPASQALSAGQTATFNVGVTGAPPFSFQWLRNGGAIPGATNSSYTTPIVTTTDNGSSFIVVVSNLLNVVTSSPPALLNLLLPPVITAQPQDQVVAFGSPVDFSVTVDSQAPVTCQWRFQGIALDGQNDSTLSIPSASVADAGGYDVIASNSAGAVTSRVAILVIQTFDFGDAPEPYPTLLANNGARHLLLPGIFLGSGVDYEIDGQPDTLAEADDLAEIDDEDGVQFLEPLRVGQAASIEVVASTNGYLNAWLDFDGNGSWADAGDQIFTNRPLVAGTNLLSFLVPPTTTASSSYARFRFNSTGGLSFDGLANDGEVEDYAVTITPVADLAVTVTDAPDPLPVNGNLVYTISVLNQGPSAASGVVVTSQLPAGVTIIDAHSTLGSCTVSGPTIQCALGNLGHDSATITITVTPTAVGFVTNLISVSGVELDLVAGNNTAQAVTDVATPPSIVTQPPSLAVTQDTQVTLSVTATGSSPLFYQWRCEGVDLPGKTNSTLIFSSVDQTNAGAYQVQVSNRVGSVLSATANLTVLTWPKILQQAQSSTNPAGARVVLQVVADGTAPLGYQWYYNANTFLEGATNASLVLDNVTLAQTGDYKVVITNSYGAITSATARLTILNMDFGDAPDPPYPTLLANNGARHFIEPDFYLGNGVDSEGDGQPDANALGDNNTGTDDEDGVTFLTPLLFGQNVQIAVVASTNGLLNAWLDFNANGTWADAGDQIFTNQSLVRGTNLLSLHIPAAAHTTNTFARFRFSSQADLSFTGDAADGEVEDYAVTIAPAVELAIQVQKQVEFVRLGDSFTYTVYVTNNGPSAATAVDLQQQWSSPVTLVGATGNGCSQSDTVLVCPLGDMPAGTALSVTLTIIPALPELVTNVLTVSSVEADLNTTNNNTLFHLPVLVPPGIVYPPAGQIVTNGDSVSFTVSASGNMLQYQWRFNGTKLPGATNAALGFIAQPQLAGYYSVVVSNLLGAITSDPALLTVLVPPRITSQPQSLVVMAETNVQMQVSADGTEPLAFQWLFNGVEIFGATTPILLLPNVAPEQAGEYRVRVSNQAGEVLSQAAILTVLEPPVILVQPQGGTNYAGGILQLTTAAHGTEPLHYQWYYNQGILGAEINPTLVVSNVQKYHSGDYYVVITNVAGTVTSAAAQVTIIEADFGDAPGGYPSLLAFNGARHQVLSGIRLGPAIDYEPDARLNSDGTSDPDDDGVTFLTPLVVGQPASVQVVASTNGFLDAWIDFDCNTGWAEPTDQIASRLPLTAGTNLVPFLVPSNAVPSSSFARFRFSTMGGLSYDGFAADGEVEDYPVSIQPVADLGIALSVDPPIVPVNSLFTYTLTISNQGPNTAATVWVTNALPPGTLFLSASANDACTSDAGLVTCALSALGAGEKTNLILVVQSLTTPQVVTNRAQVAAREIDINPGNNSAIIANTIVGTGPPCQNTNWIIIPDVGPALPYPSSILVSGVTAAVYKVTVTLSNLSHLYPADLQILLVGPGGQHSLLMADIGIFPANNVTLTFDDYAAASLTERISSGVYRPTYRGSGLPNFASPAPAGPYTNNLSVFRGTDPNGLWSLYILDDSTNDAGYVANGWSLNISTLEPLANLGLRQVSVPNVVGLGSNLTCLVFVTNAGPSDAIDVKVLDQLPATVTFLSASSSAGTCTQQDGLVICTLTNLAAGAEALITLQVRPLQEGWLTNSVSVSSWTLDLYQNNNTNFLGTLVKPVTDLTLSMSAAPAPAILGGQVTYRLAVTNQGPNVATKVVVQDTLPAGIDFVSAVASQGACSQIAGVVRCDLGNLAIGADATVTIVGQPKVVDFQTNIANVSAYELDSNASNNFAQAVTQVVVPIGPFASSGPATIPAQGIALTYPSTIYVTGLTGEIFSVTATLSNLTHQVPADLDILLVSPAGQTVLLMSDAGGVTAVQNLNLTFDDAAVSMLSQAGPLTSGTFQPSNFGLDSDVFPSPAPPGPYGAALSVFRGANPNGTWSLYIVDDQPNGSGSLDGWSLDFQTFHPIVDLDLDVTASPSPVGVGSNLLQTIVVTNPGPAAATRVSLNSTLTTNLSVVSVTSSQGACTQTPAGIACNLGTIVMGGSVSVTIEGIPLLSGWVTNDVITSALERDWSPSNNVRHWIISVQDPPVVIQQPLSQLRTNLDSVTFTALAQGAEPLSYQWLFNGTPLPAATAPVLTLSNLSLAQAGTYRLQVTNFVGAVQSDIAVLTVLARPVISQLQTQTVFEDVLLGPLQFTVGDVETSAENLLVNATCSSPSLFPAANIWLGGSGSNRTVTLLAATNQFGAAIITLWVTDESGIQASNSFTVVVTSVNDLPIISGISSQVTTDEDVSTVVPFQVQDVETSADALIVTAYSGSLALVADSDIVLSGTGTNRLMTITPMTNQYGTATVFLQVRDSDDGTNTQSVDLIINPINDPPTLNPIADLDLDEDAPEQSIQLSGISAGPNETQPLTVAAVSSNHALFPDPTVSYLSPNSNGVLRFTLLPNAFGTSTVTVSVSDGQALNSTITRIFQVRVRSVNDLPLISQVPSQTILEDTATDWLAFTVGDMESSPDSLQLAATSSAPELIPNTNILVSGTGSNRLVQVIPLTNAFGTANITITVTDPDNGNATTTFSVEVVPVNDWPTLDPIPDITVQQNSGLKTIALTGITSGASNEPDVLVLTASVFPDGIITNLTVQYTSPNNTGSLSFETRTNVSGLASITINVSDSGASNNVVSRSFKLLVNAPPNIAPIPEFVIQEDSGTNWMNFVLSDLDSVDLQTVQLTAYSLDQNLVPDGNLVVSHTGQSGLLAIMPLKDAYGSTDIVLTAQDADGGVSSTPFQVTVLAVNDPPTLNVLSDLSINEDTGTTVVPLGGITFGAANEYQVLTLTATATPGGILTNLQIVYQSPDTSGTLSFGTVTNAVGNVTVIVFVNDGQDTTSRSFVLHVNEINDPPFLSGIPNQVIDEDTALGPISFIIGDVESSPAALIMSATSSNPALLDQPNIVFGGNGSNRTVSILPATNAFGTATITLHVSDEAGAESTAGFLLTVNPVNDPPWLSGIPDQVTSEGMPLTVNFIVFDLETLPGSLTLTGFSSNGALVPDTNIVLNGTGTNRTATITPIPNQFGVTTITLEVRDSDGATKRVSFSLQVNQSSEPPTLAPIAPLSVAEDSGPQEVSLSGITSGTPVQMHPLTITAVSSDPSIIPDPLVTYTNPASIGKLTFLPWTNANGVVTIFVAVNNHESQSNLFTQSFQVTVQPVNDLPTISAIGDMSTFDGVPKLASFQISDAENPAASLLVSGHSSNPSLLPDTSIVFGGLGNTRTVLLTPTAGQSGSAQITLTVRDADGGTATTSFGLTVSLGAGVPTISSIADQTIDEDTGTAAIPFTIHGITSTNNLMLTAVSSNLVLLPNANIVLGGTGTNRTIALRPTTNQFGTSLVTLTASNSTLSSTRSFLLRVNPVNDPPVISSIAAQSMSEDGTLSVAFSITDPETPAVNLGLTITSTNNSLVGSTNLWVDGFSTNRTLVIQPAPDQSGTTLLTLNVSDGTLTSTSSFVLTVNSVNDWPTLDPLPPVFLSFNPGAISVNLSNITAGAANEVQTLSVTVTNNNSGFYQTTPKVTSYTSPNTTGTIGFRPSNASSGSNLVTVTVSDNGATNNQVQQSFYVFVRPNNSLAPPTAIGLTNVVTQEDVPLTNLPFRISSASTPVSSLGLASFSSNPKLLALSNIVFGGSGSNRTVSLYPSLHQTGAVWVAVSVLDTNYGGTNLSFTLTVNPLNAGPQITGLTNVILAEGTSSAPLAFQVSDDNTPASALSVTATSDNSALVSNGNLALLGSGTNRAIMVTPFVGQTGSARISVIVSNGVKSGTNAFVVTVYAVDQLPFVSSIPDQSVNQGTSLEIDFVVGDRETPAASLVVTSSCSNPSLLPQGSLVFSGTGSNRHLTILASQVGSGIVTMTVTDTNAATASSSFNLVVQPVNQSPTISVIADQAIPQNTATATIPFTIGDLETAATNLVLSSSSSHPLLVPDANILLAGSASNRTIRVTPALNRSGQSLVSVMVTDEAGASVIQTFVLTVNAVNQPPTVSAIPDITITEDNSSGEIPFTVRDAETASGSLLLSAHTSDQSIIADPSIRFGGNGLTRYVEFLPQTNQVGTVMITVAVHDPNGASSSNSFSVTITPVNDFPFISDLPDQQIQENTPSAPINFVVWDVETPASNLVVTVSSSNQSLIPNSGIALSGTGSNRTAIITPASNQYGTAEITVTVDDGQGGSASQKVMLTVQQKVLAQPNFTELRKTNDVVELSFTTTAGLTYIVEVKTLLSDPWATLQSVTGSGSIMTVQDPGAGASSRFYRIRME